MPQHYPLQLRAGEDLVYTVQDGEIFKATVSEETGDTKACIHFLLSKGGVLHIYSSIGTKEKPFPKIIIEADPTATVVFWADLHVTSKVLYGSPLEVYKDGDDVVYRRSFDDEDPPLVGAMSAMELDGGN